MTDIRQFCDACGRKIIEGGCPEPCKGDGRPAFSVHHPQGYTYELRAKDAASALSTVASERGWDASITVDCLVFEL